jgi:hypothetical protein
MPAGQAFARGRLFEHRRATAAAMFDGGGLLARGGWCAHAVLQKKKSLPGLRRAGWLRKKISVKSASSAYLESASS